MSSSSTLSAVSATTSYRLPTRVPSEDAECVRKLRAAGAVLLGKLNMHEFAYGGTSAVTHYGPVHNPWNLAYNPGGSSGGSAAAVAARLCAAALGTDTAASVRFPASCCGVVGSLPPSGRIPVAGAWGRDDWSRVGPLARSVADCALVTDLVSGYHPSDHFSLRDPSSIGTPDPDVRGMRVALSYDLGDWP